MSSPGPQTWWARPGMEPREGRLVVAGRDAEGLARAHGTPLIVYDLARIEEQATALRAAMLGAGLNPIVRLALKAQREPEVLAFLRARCPWLGIDACSPGEVRHAIEHGWGPEEISFTGTNVSDRDLDVIVASGVHVNVDLCSQLERLGRRASGSGVGLRVNPRAGASYAGGGSKYAGERASKFGLFAEQLPDALAIAARHDLTIDTVHVHVGDGFLTPGLDHVDVAIGRVAAMARTLVDAGCPIREVNTGGGLGVPHQAGDEPLDLARWASILAGHLAPLGVSVATEPGDFLVKEAGVLLAEVITVEDRDGDRFVGLDAGWHQACEHFIYGDRLEVVAVAATDAEPAMRTNVTGNINEGDDLFAESRPMPEVAEGDVVAVLPVGAYGASMASHHCMRPPASSVAFADREAPA